MRIISRNTIKTFGKQNPDAEESLKAWFDEVRNVKWKSPNDLKEKYHNASIINSKRVVFNIKGNLFRLIVDIEYKIGIIFIVWIGRHNEYDKINVEDIKYVKAR